VVTTRRHNHRKVELRTPLCDELGIEYPILSVGFGLGATPELAAAVSNAGGCGVVGTGGGMTLELVRAQNLRVRELTRRPFGANVLLNGQGDLEFRPRLDARISLLIEQQVPLIVFFWGDPSPYVKDAHGHGVKVFVQVGSVDEARNAADAGVDAVIAQGSEAGGHVRSTTPIWEIVPATVKAVKPLPVLASGGIGDGKSIAKAIMLGAQGVSLGTRFVASEEAVAHRAYKERVVQSSAEDTVYTEDLFDIGWPNAPHRVIRNKVVEEWEAAGRPPPGKRPGEGTTIGMYRYPWGEEEPWGRYEVGMPIPGFQGDIEYAPLWAGTSVSDINDVKPAGEIVRDLVREAEVALAAR
jgi:NAD(P)H-dependent flavin oxidoreductase YrpB (nitropropane dioxygenase family)